MRESEELKDKGKKTKIYDDQTLENIKKYYNIEDHEDLLKFIKLNRLANNLNYYCHKDDYVCIRINLNNNLNFLVTNNT